MIKPGYRITLEKQTKLSDHVLHYVNTRKNVNGTRHTLFIKTVMTCLQSPNITIDCQ